LKKRFQKNVENFVCENCGLNVKGNGYTNHCPNCLYSKHVDNNPGDRESNCLGLMLPTDLINRDNTFYIVHKCKNCGHIKNNKAVPGDNFDKLIEISRQDRG